jgi:tetratricopeptide (TPR) repeat protein
MERIDLMDDAWDGVAARVALGELPSETEIAHALEGAGALDDPRALERVRASLDRFWELVHDAPGRALGLALVAAVVADHQAAPTALRSELRRRQATALFALGRARDSADALDEALRVLARDPGADALEAARTRAALLGFLGNARLAMGEVRPALVALEEAISLARAQGLKQALGTYLSSLGNARFFSGEARAAVAYYEDALALAREVGSREGEAVNLNNLGLARQALGDHEGALECYQDAMTIARTLGDRRSGGAIEANISQVHFEQGALDDALTHQEAALELARAADDRGTQAVSLLRLAAIARERGAVSEAHARTEEAAQLLEAMDDPRRSGAWIEAGRVRVEVGELEAARGLFARALEAARAVGDGRGALAALRERGRAERLLGRYMESALDLGLALSLALDVEDLDLEALVRLDIAETFAALRETQKARSALQRAADRVAARPGSLLEAQHALARAAVAQAVGETAEAREVLEELVRSARERGLVAFQREAARRLGALPPP